MVKYRIHWMTPLAPSCQYCYLLDKLHFRIGMHSDNFMHNAPEDYKVELWTNMYHKEDNEGEWHAVAMTYQSTESVQDCGDVIYFYGVDLIVTCMGVFEFTYRAKHKFDQKYEWANWIHVNGCIQVRRQIDKLTTWIQEPECAKVTHNVHIGNYMAAMEAADNGFDCLLNLSEEAPVFPQQLSKPIIFMKFPLPFGANNVISQDVVCKAVKWLRAMSDRCRRILVASRDGHGRAGSIMIAFIYAMNPNLTFEEAHKFVDDRHFVYFHKGLKDTLAKLFPRD